MSAREFWRQVARNLFTDSMARSWQERAAEWERIATSAAPTIAAQEQRIADLEKQLAGRVFFLAEHEGVEPTLWTTDAEAREACDDIARAEARGRSWDWVVNEDGVTEQVWVDPDDDRPTWATGGAVWQLTVEHTKAGERR